MSLDAHHAGVDGEDWDAACYAETAVTLRAMTDALGSSSRQTQLPMFMKPAAGPGRQHPGTPSWMRPAAEPTSPGPARRVAAPRGKGRPKSNMDRALRSSILANQAVESAARLMIMAAQQAQATQQQRSPPVTSTSQQPSSIQPPSPRVQHPAEQEGKLEASAGEVHTPVKPGGSHAEDSQLAPKSGVKRPRRAQKGAGIACCGYRAPRNRELRKIWEEKKKLYATTAAELDALYPLREHATVRSSRQAGYWKFVTEHMKAAKDRAGKDFDAQVALAAAASAWKLNIMEEAGATLAAESREGTS